MKPIVPASEVKKRHFLLNIMSKENFFLMRAEQMATLYDATFTKKEAVKQGSELVQKVLNDGLIGKHEFMSNLSRLKAVIDTAESEMRKNLPHEKTTVLGVEFNPVDGGNTINNFECIVWNKLKADLEARTELLKLAQKQEVLDLGGIEVPKVGTTPRKSSITIKF